MATIEGIDWSWLGNEVIVRDKAGGEFHGVVRGVGTRYVLVLVDRIDIGHGFAKVTPEIRQFPYPVEVSNA